MRLSIRIIHVLIFCPAAVVADVTGNHGVRLDTITISGKHRFVRMEENGLEEDYHKNQNDKKRKKSRSIHR